MAERNFCAAAQHPGNFFHFFIAAELDYAGNGPVVHGFFVYLK